MKKSNTSVNFYFLFLFFFGLVYQLPGRSVDSIQSLINSSEGTQKSELLLELSEYYLGHLPERTVELATEALGLAHKQGNRKLQADAMYNIADGYRVMGDNIKALDYFLQSLRIN
ncbi:MAG: tetratricopeptide repeat protein [Bacteroidales bacterium]